LKFGELSDLTCDVALNVEELEADCGTTLVENFEKRQLSK